MTGPFSSSQQILAGSVSPTTFTPKDAVSLATTAALPAYTVSNAGSRLTASAPAALTIDGTAVTVGMRVLVKNGASAVDNGIYVVTIAGAIGTEWVLDRASDMPVGSSASGFQCFVTEGSTLANSAWAVTNAPGSDLVGTNSLTIAAAYAEIFSSQIVMGAARLGAGAGTIAFANDSTSGVYLDNGASFFRMIGQGAGFFTFGNSNLNIQLIGFQGEILLAGGVSLIAPVAVPISFTINNANAVAEFLGDSSGLQLGTGDGTATPGAFGMTVRGPNGAGNNVPGAALNWVAPRGTGTGAVGYHSYQAGLVGLTGTTPHVVNEYMRGYASGVAIAGAGGGIIAPAACAVLDLQSTTQGFMLPRMTLVQANAIANLTVGMIVYVTNGRKAGEGAGAGTGVMAYYSNGSWRDFSNDSPTAT